MIELFTNVWRKVKLNGKKVIIIYYACKIPDMLKEPYYNSVKIPLY